MTVHLRPLTPAEKLMAKDPDAMTSAPLPTAEQEKQLKLGHRITQLTDALCTVLEEVEDGTANDVEASKKRAHVMIDLRTKLLHEYTDAL